LNQSGKHNMLCAKDAHVVTSNCSKPKLSLDARDDGDRTIRHDWIVHLAKAISHSDGADLWACLRIVSGQPNSRLINGCKKSNHLVRSVLVNQFAEPFATHCGLEQHHTRAFLEQLAEQSRAQIKEARSQIGFVQDHTIHAPASANQIGNVRGSLEPNVGILSNKKHLILSALEGRVRTAHPTISRISGFPFHFQL
jgi:hypothetical protein